MSFGNILLFNDMIRDDELDDKIKIDIGLAMLIKDELPELDFEVKVEIFKSLVKGIFPKQEEHKVYDILGNEMPSMVIESDTDVDYDLLHDAEYIYASFMQCYGIDLVDVSDTLHWQKFQALLSGLSDDTKFMRVMEILCVWMSLLSFQCCTERKEETSTHIVS